MKTTNFNNETKAARYDKMQLQRDFMDCWQTAIDTPMRYRVIIELDEEDETNAGKDEDGKKHALNKYIMIDGSDGDDNLFDDNKWLISSSWKNDPTLVKPESVMPTVLHVIDSGHVKEIYNDGY